jgi:hypothetical protein
VTVAACKSCRAPITWVASNATGKPMPLDAAPVATGNVVVVEGRATVLGPLELLCLGAGVQRFVSHFVTCPHASSWRASEKDAAHA